jgi:hypothetical protein
MVPPIDRFWADPFVIERDNKFYIFVEEFVYNRNKGHISVISVDINGNYSKPTKVLEKSYHLSYPFLFKEGSDLYMIPETKQNKTIDLYKCVEFPFKWTFETTLIKEIEAVDSTIIYRDNKYWLFTNIAANKGASNFDELYVFSSKTLDYGSWEPHPKNPVVSDVKQARPAGGFFEYQNNLYRPSQNNTIRYGYGMKINKVVELNELNYEEIPVNEIFPNWDDDIIATHTLSSDGKITVIDGLLKRKRRPFNFLNNLFK